jgi:hypothetical protein
MAVFYVLVAIMRTWITCFSHAILVTEWEHGDVLFQIEEVLDSPSCCGVFLACWNI